MNLRNLNIILLCSFLLAGKSAAQINCTVPLPPDLTSVSVQPETGKTEFTWIPSESTDIAAYIVYSYSGGDGHPIDTVWNPSATYDIISNNAPKYSSVSYVVAAYRLSAIPGESGCISPLSNVLSTIFCQATLDTCNRKININWNKYASIPRMVDSYTLLFSVNGGSFAEIETTDTATHTFTYNNFITGADYCFYVKANLAGGYSSTSNKECITTNMQRPPDWINADYATVNQDNKISLSFTIDPNSQIRQFLLERKTGRDGNFEPVTTLHTSEDVATYTDDNADAGRINIYRLSAINSCNNPITISNLASNIVLDLKSDGNLIDLSWNPYIQWLGILNDYRLFVNPGNGYVEKSVIQADDTTLSYDYREIMYDVSAHQVCFYILATESSNPHSVAGQSKSQEFCIDPLEIITVPNIFTPNNDLKNDLFRPVLSFTSISYNLVISDPHGKVLFESRDQNESWDGTIKGNPQPDGVCLWFLKVTAPSGKSIKRSGTVTLLRVP